MPVAIPATLPGSTYMGVMFHKIILFFRMMGCWPMPITTPQLTHKLFMSAYIRHIHRYPAHLEAVPSVCIDVPTMNLETYKGTIRIQHQMLFA
jgi:hypothetical protein